MGNPFHLSIDLLASQEILSNFLSFYTKKSLKGKYSQVLLNVLNYQLSFLFHTSTISKHDLITEINISQGFLQKNVSKNNQ